jgi:hypothetical protein
VEPLRRDRTGHAANHFPTADLREWATEPVARATGPELAIRNAELELVVEPDALRRG